MSRVGKKTIKIPNGVNVKLDNQRVSVKGPKGELERVIPSEVTIEKTDNEINLYPVKSRAEKRANALHGLARTLVANMVNGVTQGFRKELKIVGIGYRANVSGKILNLFLGYSHPIKYEIPERIKIEVTKDNSIIIEGIDKEEVGQVAAEIREYRKPEPYKGKGIRYAEEKLRTKVGKAGA